MAYLIVYTANAPAQKVKLEGPAVVGRALGSEVWLDDQNLSRQHCRIEPSKKGWVLIDLDSTNGTFVHRHRIKKHRLVEGDSFDVGKARIVFREGEFVGHRPIDPFEAASMGPRKGIKRTNPDLENTTIVGQRLPQVKVTVAEDVKRKRPKQHVPLAFKRPPARPIVKQDEAIGTSGPAVESSRWFDSLTSRFRRS
jgi:predicted component of type VI protein secretion system